MILHPSWLEGEFKADVWPEFLPVIVFHLQMAPDAHARLLGIGLASFKIDEAVVDKAGFSPFGPYIAPVASTGTFRNWTGEVRVQIDKVTPGFHAVYLRVYWPPVGEDNGITPQAHL